MNTIHAVQEFVRENPVSVAGFWTACLAAGVSYGARFLGPLFFN